MVEDLKIGTPAVFAYFFCRDDEAESLETRTIISSIARQIFDYVKSDMVDAIAEIKDGSDVIYDTNKILHYLRTLLTNSHRYIIVIDGLDECSENCYIACNIYFRPIWFSKCTVPVRQIFLHGHVVVCFLNHNGKYSCHR